MGALQRRQQRGDVATRRTDIERGDQSLSAGSARGERGGAVGLETGQGERIGLARDSESGDLYAGRNGEVFRRSDDGWSQHDGESWQSIDVPAERQQQIDSARSRATDTRSQLESTLPSRDFGRSSSSSRSRDFNRSRDLNRSYNARSGGYNRFNNSRSGSRSLGGGGFRRR